MAIKHRYSIDEVKSTYSPAKAREEWYGDWASALIFRPLSFLLTPPLLRLGFSASTVTLLSLLTGLSLPLIALYGSVSSILWVAGLATVWLVLDCVDGNIARVLGTAGCAGQYFDFAADVLFRGCFYAAIGLLADALPGAKGNGFQLTMLAAYVAMAARFCRLFYARQSGTDIYEDPGPVKPRGVAQIIFSFLSGLDRLLPLMVLGGGLAGRMDWIIFFLLIYSGLDFLYSQFSIVCRIRGT